jgi:hypothetical protein
MIPPTNELPWYIDSRPFVSSDKMSLDLTRQLPQRALLGPVVILSGRPVVMLAVVKKRWTKIIREVERQYSATLNRQKKDCLQSELQRLRDYIFSANEYNPSANIFFISPIHAARTPFCKSLYLTDPLPPEQLLAAAKRLRPGGLLVSYADSERALTAALLRQA